MEGKYFVFVDETGVNYSDKYFGIGCLMVPVDKIGEYYRVLQSQRGKIITAVKKKEEEIALELDAESLVKFYKGRRAPYEMKFKNINASTVQQYEWLIYHYFKMPELRFCCLIIDRHFDKPPAQFSNFDLYIERLFMLLKNNVGDAEFVVLPDDITTPKQNCYESSLLTKLVDSGKKCFGVHRLESHSSIFVQMVDVLVGACVFDLKMAKIPPSRV